MAARRVIRFAVILDLSIVFLDLSIVILDLSIVILGLEPRIARIPVSRAISTLGARPRMLGSSPSMTAG